MTTGHTIPPRPRAMEVPTGSSPRWLTLVLRCDRALSSWFIGGGFFFAPILLIIDPWPIAVAIAWMAISLSGLWLGLLGIFMAIGLARVLRSGDEIPEEYWSGMLDYRSAPEVRKTSATPSERATV